MAEAACYASRLPMPSSDSLSSEMKAKLEAIYAHIDKEEMAKPYYWANIDF